MAVRGLSRADAFVWLFAKDTSISDSVISKALNEAKKKSVTLGKYRISYIRTKGYTIEKKEQ